MAMAMTFDEYREKYGLCLTEAQEKAVRTKKVRVLLLAVPGSGKTTVITARLGYLEKCLGVDPERCLTLTFSVASCRDMKERYRRLFGDGEKTPQFRTIHGVCALILRRYGEETGHSVFRLAEDGECTGILAGILAKHLGYRPSSADLADMKTSITYAVNRMLTKEEIALSPERFPKHFAAVLPEFSEAKKERQIMDYDDQLVYALSILRKCPSVLSYFRKKFPYISVDEAQDTSKIQHKIIELLAENGGNLFMVGDEDQSIYGFRAAYPEALLDFDKRYPDAEVLFIERNFRSTPDIVEGAKRLIAENKARRSKDMTAEKCKEGRVVEKSVQDPKKQTEYILSLAKEAASSPAKSCAVLYRNNESALPALDKLIKKGVPFTCRENDGAFFDSPEVVALCDMLRFCKDPEDTELFLRLYPHLGIGLSRTEAETIVEKCRKTGKNLEECVLTSELLSMQNLRNAEKLFYEARSAARLTAFGALRRLCDETAFGYVLKMRGNGMKTAIMLELARDDDNIDGYLAHLDSLSKFVREEREYREDCLVLSTMHASKGLEFDKAVILDARNGIIPALPPSPLCDAEEMAAIEEERRLFYVACTRAKEELVFLHCEKPGDVPGEKSVFIREFLGERSANGAAFCEGVPPSKSGIFGRMQSCFSRLRSPAGSVSKESKCAMASPEKDPYCDGAGIRHVLLGSGTIVGRKGNTVRIRFDTAEEKTFELSLLLSRKLLLLSDTEKKNQNGKD